MSDPRECPVVEQLELLATGRLSDPTAGDLEEHLLSCEACARQTAQFHADDTLISAMRDARSIVVPRSPDEQTRLDGLMGSLSGLRRERLEATALFNLPEASDAVSSLAQEVTREFQAVWQPAQQSDELGRLGDYRVLKLLGAGGMGAVFLAEDVQLRRRVALKLMRPRAATASGAAERFLREARTAASVRHDHIVVIHQVGKERDIPFLAMEYLTGESLEDRLWRSSGPLPIREALCIGQQIAAGLAAAHEQSLIHRDIKPANVWLESSPVAPRLESRSTKDAITTEGTSQANHAESVVGTAVAERPSDVRVKLLDFGLARGLDDDTRITTAGMIVGTPSFMAPEQASGDEIDQRADLFSLGCVLYRMTTGRLPFPGAKTLEVLRALATITPTSPRDVNPDVPQPLSDLINQLLQKDRTARPASARDVAIRMAALSRPVLEAKPNQNTERSRASILRIAIGLAACLLFGAIIITLKDKDGKETKITVNAPPGSKLVGVEVSEPESENPKPGNNPASRGPVPMALVNSPQNPPVAVPNEKTSVLTGMRVGPVRLALTGMIPRPARLPGISRWQALTPGLRGIAG